MEESPVSAALKRSFSLISRPSDFFGGSVSMSMVGLYGRIADLGFAQGFGDFLIRCTVCLLVTVTHSHSPTSVNFFLNVVVKVKKKSF